MKVSKSRKSEAERNRAEEIVQFIEGGRNNEEVSVGEQEKQ